MTIETPSRSFTEQFAAARPGLPGASLPWLARMRSEALDRFQSLGLPTRRAEAWKYTDLGVLGKTAYGLAGDASVPVRKDAIPSLVPGRVGPIRLVFVDGRFRGDLSAGSGAETGVEVGPLGALVEQQPGVFERHLGQIGVLDRQPLLALNTAFMADGFVVRVGSGVRTETPVEIVFVGGLADRPVSYHPRNLILVEDGAAAPVVEHHVALGPGAYFANGVTEVRVAEGGELRHYKVQAEGQDAVHIATGHAEVAGGGTYEAFGLAVGSRLARNEASVRLVGEGARCGLSGAYLARDSQHCDNTTLIEHRVPHTACRELFKGVVDDRARAVFQGKIIVHRDAQKTDARQLNRTLLLSDGAEIDTKPELEIYADDVKCSHGATAGDLDHDALFYLRARGVPEPVARKILVEAFVREALDEVSSETVRTAMMAYVSDWLARGRREAS